MCWPPSIVPAITNIWLSRNDTEIEEWVFHNFSIYCRSSGGGSHSKCPFPWSHHCFRDHISRLVNNVLWPPVACNHTVRLAGEALNNTTLLSVYMFFQYQVSIFRVFARSTSDALWALLNNVFHNYIQIYNWSHSKLICAYESNSNNQWDKLVKLDDICVEAELIIKAAFFCWFVLTLGGRRTPERAAKPTARAFYCLTNVFWNISKQLCPHLANIDQH